MNRETPWSVTLASEDCLIHVIKKIQFKVYKEPNNFHNVSYETTIDFFMHSTQLSG